MPKRLRPDLSVRLVAHDYPESREVFRRYGEEEGRAVFGHLETLAGFARRRGVPLDALLEELAAATGLTVDREAPRAEGLHRPFVLVALLLSLTVGAGWGAWLLARIGLGGSFDAVPAAHIVAHGEAQLWALAAIFVIGIALRYLPTVTSQPFPGVAARGFVLTCLCAGVVGGFVWSLAPADAAVLGPLSGALLIAGSWTYAVLVLGWLRTKLDQTWARFVLAAAGWEVLWACWTLFLRTRAAAAGPLAYEPSERQIGMDLALLGVVLGSVFGFGTKLLPGFLGMPRVRPALHSSAFWLHQTGMVVLLIGRFGRRPGASAAGLLFIFLGSVCFVAALRGLRGRPSLDRPEKGHPLLRRYMQLAFGWLLVSLCGFTWLAFWERFEGLSAPHALHGALRHAFTVGFLVTAILGVGQRLLPVLGHTVLARPGSVWAIFVCIAAGNLLRVAGEVATIRWESAFLVMPFSAGFEWTALLLFTIAAVRTMWPPPDPLLRDGRVTREGRVAALLEAHPWLEDELIDWGIDYVRRVRQVPSSLTIGTFAEGNGFEPGALIARIEAAIAARGERAPAS